MLHDLINMAIPGVVQLRAKGVAGEALTFFHHQGVAVKIAVRADALHQRIHRHNQHAALHGRKLIQRRQARRDNLLMRREAVIRQRFPVGQAKYQAIGELPDFVMQAQGILHIRRNQDYRPRMALSDFCHQRGARRAREFAQLALVARVDRQGITIVFRHGFVRVSYGYTNSIGAYH
ncbi:hypothetical protein ENTCAN_05670 [Enterobacter cancerogenus ATCC 35316]|nr:hypothetical protein ENTCAN_05670 [Enterobacter cancerogenus ATCC 35316]